ncbi:ATP-binding protein [Agrobacterium vaccinii]|uniref:ATP-binding protein n=1 Tax=Agrobacterium vaccinii TaxID=2735528 RepID=UPI001E4768C2|nr:ATP-binding protein [Agrobacterium vaccinii]UHS61336.1 ATP-binding protein [Agrobacterium vaccinii]
MARNNMNPELIEALSRVRASMPQSELDVADRIAEISAKHVETHRDRAFNSRFRKMKRSLVAHFSGDTKQHRILIVTGESHSGKTAMIENALDNDAGFDPYPDSNGNMTMPVLRMECASPAYLVNVALDGLEALGYPMDPKTREKVAWTEFRKRLKQRKVLLVFIDEAQHSVNSTNGAELQKLRDILKHMVQMKDWPIRIILAGVPPLEKFREDQQIRKRSMTLHLGPLTTGHNDEHVRHWVKKIVTEHAEMEIDDFMAGDFPQRLIHACGGCFGSIVQLTRLAIEEELMKGAATVGAPSFANAYKTMTGCLVNENIFTAKTWHQIQGSGAKLESGSTSGSTTDYDDDKPCAARLKPLRGGERPK